LRSRIHYRADFERFAERLLNQVQIHLTNQPALQWVVAIGLSADSKQQRISHRKEMVDKIRCIE
jgi:hypothetical protein